MDPPSTPPRSPPKTPFVSLSPVSCTCFDPDWEFDAPQWFNLSSLMQPSVPTTPLRRTSPQHGSTLSTPNPSQIIAAFLETPSITRYFANHASTPSDRPLTFLSFSDQYTSDQLGDALMAVDNDSFDASVDPDSPARISEGDQLAEQCLSHQPKQRRISAIFHVYPDSDLLRCPRSQPMTPPTPYLLPGTPRNATTFHWTPQLANPFPVFPQISTTETVIFSPCKPVVRRKQRKPAPPRLTVPQEFSFMKRAHSPVRAITSPLINKGSQVPKSHIHRVRGITQVKPFFFKTSQRAARRQRVAPTPPVRPAFRARELKESIFERPFIPHPSTKPPTSTDKAPHLHTTERAAQRLQFDTRVHERIANEELEMQRAQEAQQEELNKVVRELRQHLVHRARPVPKWMARH